MAKVDRSILAANDQSMGQFGDPDKLEASISHLADKIDENDNDTEVLKTDNTSNKGRLTALEEDVSVLEAEDAINKSKIATNENNIAYNESRLIELLRNTQQASEVVDARLGFPLLRNKLENVDLQLAEKAAQYFKYDADQTNGLSAYFGSAKIQDSNKNWIEFSGGNVNLPDNQTYEVMFDLFDKKLHALPRAIHTGGIHIATVTTSSGVITDVKQPVNFQLPKTRLFNTKNKFKYSYQTVRGALFGDSLTEGAGGTPRWTTLLFDYTSTNKTFNLPLINTLAVDNYAVGSQTAEYNFALLGEAVTSNKGGLNNTNITYKSAMNTYVNNGVPAKKSPILEKAYDFAILGIGANGGNYKLNLIENMVKILRSHGVEVILQTENYRSDSSTFLYSDGEHLKRIADTYGCELADTWSYFKEMENSGQVVFSDTIHQSAKGHEAYAAAIRSVFNSEAQEKETNLFELSGRITEGTTAPETLKMPYVPEVMFTPSEHTGTVVSGTRNDNIKNPALLYGSKDASNYITQLEIGQSATFPHAYAKSVSVLYEMSTDCTFEVRKVNGNVLLNTFTTTNTGLNRIGSTACLNLNLLTDLTSGIYGITNQAIKIIVTVGTLKLVGVCFYTDKVKEIYWDDILFKGSWVEEGWSYSALLAKGTDTISDSFTFKYKGSGFILLLGNKSASGIVDIYVDGKKEYSQLDLYNSGTYLKPVMFTHGFADNLVKNNQQEHIVKVVLTGANASAISPVGFNRRLTLLNVYIIN